MDCENKQQPREDYSKEFSLYPSTFDSTASKSYENNTNPHYEQLNAQLLNKYKEEQFNSQSIFSLYSHDEKCQQQENHDKNNDQEQENPALFSYETSFQLNYQHPQQQFQEFQKPQYNGQQHYSDDQYQNIYNPYMNYQKKDQLNYDYYNNQQLHYQQLNNQYPYSKDYQNNFSEDQQFESEQGFINDKYFDEEKQEFSSKNQNCCEESECHGNQQESFQMNDDYFSPNINNNRFQLEPIQILQELQFQSTISLEINNNSSQIYEKQQMKVTPSEQNFSKNLPPTEKRITKKRQRKRQKNAIQEDICQETKNLANYTFKFLFEQIKEDYPYFEYPKDEYISITKFNNILKEQTNQLSQKEFHAFQQRMLIIIDTSLIKKVINNKNFKTTFETIKYLPGIRFMVLNPCKFSSIKQACNQALKYAL